MQRVVVFINGFAINGRQTAANLAIRNSNHIDRRIRAASVKTDGALDACLFLSTAKNAIPFSQANFIERWWWFDDNEHWHRNFVWVYLHWNEKVIDCLLFDRGKWQQEWRGITNQSISTTNKINAFPWWWRRWWCFIIEFVLNLFDPISTTSRFSGSFSPPIRTVRHL